MDKQPIKLFYSYSHKDETLRDELEDHLKSLQREGYIVSWHDRKITAGDEWKQQIHKNLEESEIILLLISSAFIGSDYCYDLEMQTALKMHEEGKATVIPVILRDCNWQIAKFSKLEAIPTDGRAITGESWHNTDAAFTVASKMLQQKIEELWRKKAIAQEPVIDPLIPETKKTLQIRSKDIPVVKKYFTGRNEKLKELKEAFDNNPFILIEGPGGIGKTQFVARFIADEGIKDKIVWFPCEPTSQPDDIIRGAGFEGILKGENKPEREKYSAFKDKIEENDLVVLLDNYQEVEGKENFKLFLWFINEYLNKGHVIIIGRDNIAGLSALQPKRLHIEGLDVSSSLEHARGLINHLYSGLVASDEVLQKICTTLQGYPLAIDLAMILLSQHTPPEQIIAAAIKHAKAGDATIEEMVERLLNEIFTRKDATQDERDFLELFSVFRGNTEINAIKAVIPESVFENSIPRLKNKNILNIQDGNYELHPLIREFCYQQLEQKEQTHIKAAHYYEAQRTNKLNPELEEKIYSHLTPAEQWTDICQTIIDKGKDFIFFGYLDQLQQMIVEVRKHNISTNIFNILEGDIAEIKSKWKEAITFFASAAKSNDEKTRIEGTIKHGEMLHRLGSTHEAKVIYEKVIKDTKESIEFRGWYARALNDLGLAYDTYENKKEALKLLNEALSIREEIHNLDDIAITLYNIAIIKTENGQYKEAIGLVEKSLKIQEEIGNKRGIGDCLHEIGRIKGRLGKNEEALQYYKKSLEISNEIGSKNGISSTLNNIGTLKDRMGKRQEALECYENSLKIDEEVGDKEGIAKCLYNIASHLIEEDKQLDLSCIYLLKSIALEKEIGKKSFSSQFILLDDLKKKKGITYFKEIIINAYNKLDESLKKQIDIHGILGEPRHVDPKIGRNDPCPCGSGKKYKACHGKGAS